MPSTLFRASLAAADARCEESAREEIVSFQKSVGYDGRFRYPNFSDVGSVWLRLIKSKESEFLATIVQSLDATPCIDEGLLAEIESVVGELLHDDHYLGRLDQFLGMVTRKAASYGVRFSPEACSFNHADAAYRCGVQNSLRAARSGIFRALQLHISKSGVAMNFSRLMTDTISVIKKTGQRFEGVKASVQSDKIFISGSDVLIESGDLIQRKMSNGGEETFEVIDPGFHEKFHSIPAGYQMNVKKLGIPEAQQALNVTTINMNGHGARVYQNSTDNSTNIITANADAQEYIKALRDAIQGANLQPAEKQAAGEVIDVVEGQIQSGRPSKPVVSALLASLPQAANVATIVTSLLSMF